MKYFLAPALLSVVGLLGAADMAMAQRGGGHGGGHSGHSSGGHSHGGSYHGGGHYHGGYGYYGGLRIGLYPGYGYSSYGYSPYYYGSYPTYSYYPSYTYSAPSVDYVAPVDTTARVRVILPDPQARVWFDGAPTSQTGSDRIFSTPPLTYTASYQIRATWLRNGREMTREQTVTVSPGQASLVDFSKASSEAVPAPRFK